MVNSKNIKYSVIIPIHNEDGAILSLLQELKIVMSKLSTPWELVLVNDGSTDRSKQKIVSMSASVKFQSIKIINLTRRYGQAAALDAGFSHASGEIIVSLDGDGQNDPKDIPRLLDKLERDNLDVVCGWRYLRQDPPLLKLTSKIGYFLKQMFSSDGVHDSGCTLRVYRKEILENIQIWGEMHRYLVALLYWQGAKIGEIKVNHRARTKNKSKYGLYKTVRGFVDLFYIWFWRRFSSRPLHLFGVIGIGLMTIGTAFLSVSIYQKLVEGTGLSRSAWFYLSTFLIVIGLQFFGLGIIMDLLIRNYFNTSKEPKYIIQSIIKK